MPRDYVISLSLILTAFFPVNLCAQESLKRFTFTEPHMGTQFRLVFYAKNELIAQKAAKAAFQRVEELNGIMSDYLKTSELMKLCQKSGGPPVKVSRDLFKILSHSQKLAAESDGAFDVTVGPAVRLWRKARRLRKLPEEDQLKEALARMGYQKIQLDPIMETVRLLVMNMLLDLGGIAKGFAADAILEVLRNFGIHSALVAAGGDIAVSDPPPNEKGWKVAIAPLKNPTEAAKVYLLLKNAAASTSGDVEQYALIDGKRYSHIVNPHTGMGLVGRSSVTVIAPNCTSSDSLATTLSVLGAKKGIAFLKSLPGTACFFVLENNQGQLETHSSKNFSRFEYPKE